MEGAESVTETSSAGDTPPETGDGDGDGDGDDSQSPDEHPMLGPVEVDGSSTPSTIDSARIVELRVAASDDVQVSNVEFFVDGESIGSAENVIGDVWQMPWLLSGESFDGEREITARATDSANQSSTSAVTSLEIDMPDSGAVVWTHPVSTQSIDSICLIRDQEVVAYVAADFPNATAGAVQTANGLNAPWADKSLTPTSADGLRATTLSVLHGETYFGGYVTELQNDDALVIKFSDDGAEAARHRASFDSAWLEQVVDLASASGKMFALIGTDNAPAAGLLVELDTLGSPISQADLSARPRALGSDGESLFVLSASGTDQPTVQRFDSQLVASGSGFPVSGRAALGVDGERGRVYVAGRNGSAFGTVTAYDYDGQLQWSVDFGQGITESIPRAIAVGPYGRTAVAGRVNGSLTTDGVVVYDAEGIELWSGDYTGLPNDVELDNVVIDALGRIYVSGQEVGVPDGGLIMQLNP